jgi:hypothetical protein
MPPTMKRPIHLIAGIVAVAMLADIAPAAARPQSNFGLGIILGQPTGVTAEFGLGASQSIDLAIGIDAFEGGGFYIHGDYLVYLPPLIQGQAELSPYLGGGIFVAGGDPEAGIRVPFGLSLDFRAQPLKLFIEVAPHLRVIDEVDLGFGAAGGFRYFF